MPQPVSIAETIANTLEGEIISGNFTQIDVGVAEAAGKEATDDGHQAASGGRVTGEIPGAAVELDVLDKEASDAAGIGGDAQAVELLTEERDALPPYGGRRPTP